MLSMLLAISLVCDLLANDYKYFDVSEITPPCERAELKLQKSLIITFSFHKTMENARQGRMVFLEHIFIQVFSDIPLFVVYFISGFYFGTVILLALQFLSSFFHWDYLLFYT